VSVLLDTGVLYAYYDRDDAWHRRAAALVRSEAGELLVPALVIPEVDHLLGQRLGRKARRTFYQSLAEGDYVAIDLPQDRYARVGEVSDRFGDLDLGFVDAAIAVLAEVLGVRRVGTTDRRHFQVLATALKLELLP
jgi:predicted nucleic acid-binding protein